MVKKHFTKNRRKKELKIEILVYCITCKIPYYVITTVKTNFDREQ